MRTMKKYKVISQENDYFVIDFIIIHLLSIGQQ